MDKSAEDTPHLNSSLDSIKKHSLHFFSGTMLSRLFGYLRDVAMAYSFGAHPLVSLFLVGFRTSNLPRRLFGEGALQSILVAKYQQKRLKCDDGSFCTDEQAGLDRMMQMQADCDKTWSFGLLGFIALVMLLLIGLEKLFNNQGGLSDDYHLILAYTCLMLPGLWFICMSALNDAFLKVKQRFLIGSMAPVAFNVVWIVFAILLRDWSIDQAMIWLCYGIILAYSLQWLVTYLGVRKERRSIKLKGQILSPSVRKLIGPMLQGIIGVGATQINGLFDAFFALGAEASGPSYLWFAIRIEQAPLALIGLAISSASIPALAGAISKGIHEEARHIFLFSQKRMMSYMLPVCSAMMCLAFIGVRVALERGDFTAYDTYRTAQCLWGYSLGLMGQSLIFLYQNLAFSLHQYALVTRSSIYAVILNVMGNWICVKFLGYGAPAIAFTTTIATFFQLFYIKQGIEWRFPRYKTPVPWLMSMKTGVLYILVGWVSVGVFAHLYQLDIVLFLQGCQFPKPSASLMISLWNFLQISVLWLVIYLPVAYLLKIPLPEIPGLIKKLLFKRFK